MLGTMLLMASTMLAAACSDDAQPIAPSPVETGLAAADGVGVGAGGAAAAPATRLPDAPADALADPRPGTEPTLYFDGTTPLPPGISESALTQRAAALMPPGVRAASSARPGRIQNLATHLLTTSDGDTILIIKWDGIENGDDLTRVRLLLEDLSGTVLLDQDFPRATRETNLNDPPTGYLILWAWAVSGEGYYGPFQIEVIEIPEDENDLRYPPGQVRNLRTSASTATCDHGPIEGCRQPTTATFTGPAGGASPTQYRVDFRENGGPRSYLQWVDAPSDRDETVRASANLQSGNWLITVRAHNTYGESTTAATSKRSVNLYWVGSVPGAPLNVRARGLGSDRWELSWDRPESDGGHRITSYEWWISNRVCGTEDKGLLQAYPLNRQRLDQGSFKITTVAGNTSSAFFKVRAVNLKGAGVCGRSR